ncbi:oxysterol-binding protein-related protein 8-like isoform X3 [Apostichopus japonicus]|uniref:oxysterol-binding protein-related protein 8-like isoform X3 n=1 Tax=Stichopus japonicus TaxID=307972 RepID=UPI003AB136B9
MLYFRRKSPKRHSLMQAAAIADSPTLLRPDRAARHKRGMSDVSPSNSSGGVVNGDTTSMGRQDLLPPTTFQGHRSHSEGKLNTTDYHGGTTTPTKHSKTDYKEQRSLYLKEKKKEKYAIKALLTDPSESIMEDHLKVRGTLRGWTKFWCKLKPGWLVIYKSQKHGHWVGSILLTNCEIIERPSKKDGFCFKIYHPLDQSIWATKGPKGETVGAITQPLPSGYLIFRAYTEEGGRLWMDALEVAQRCCNLLNKRNESDVSDDIWGEWRKTKDEPVEPDEIEKEHFKGLDEAEMDTEDKDKDEDSKSESESEVEETGSTSGPATQELKKTNYLPGQEDDLGQDSSQTETLEEENKSLIWTLMKQVRPGMDLSKVVLPTFILEPRSFLDKLSDFYFHADLLSEAVIEENAYARMKKVVRWYLSGFYKKPKGLKKPYNPIIGETFRCMWLHPKTNSQTFYISEQVSHHPPVSAFYVSNRKDGYSISCSILAKSKFYGNSVSAFMEGEGKLSFLKRGEDYSVSMPYANCKGILYGTLTMEYGGKVCIECAKTGYKTDMEFKLKPFFGGMSNCVTGKIKFGEKTLATLDGRWDDQVYIKEKNAEHSEVFWEVTPAIRGSRLTRSTVTIQEQVPMESEKLWSKCTAALKKNDVHEATNEKFILEEEQRRGHKERKLKNEEWIPKLFELDHDGQWVYIHRDHRPWDALEDIEEYEHNGIIKTRTKHPTAPVRSISIHSLLHKNSRADLQVSSKDPTSSQSKGTLSQRAVLPTSSGDSNCSTPEPGELSEVSEKDPSPRSSSDSKEGVRRVDSDMVVPLHENQRRLEDELRTINQNLGALLRVQRETNEVLRERRDWFTFSILFLISQIIVGYFFR